VMAEQVTWAEERLKSHNLSSVHLHTWVRRLHSSSMAVSCCGDKVIAEKRQSREEPHRQCEVPPNGLARPLRPDGSLHQEALGHIVDTGLRG
jgi:hypothetical protein